MKKERIISDSFFKCYKDFIDYIGIIHTGNNMCSILVLNAPVNDELSKVSVIVRNNPNNNSDGLVNEFSNFTILSNEEAYRLVNTIRNDFRDSHYISYSSINSRNLVQTLQNTKFSLNIKLNNLKEYDEAIIFNSSINCNINRHKVLTRS